MSKSGTETDIACHRVLTVTVAWKLLIPGALLGVEKRRGRCSRRIVQLQLNLHRTMKCCSGGISAPWAAVVAGAGRGGGQGDAARMGRPNQQKRPGSG